MTHSEDNCDIFSPEFFTDEHTEARDLFNNETDILTMKYLFMHTICTIYKKCNFLYASYKRLHTLEEIKDYTISLFMK